MDLALIVVGAVPGFLVVQGRAHAGLVFYLTGLSHSPFGESYNLRSIH